RRARFTAGRKQAGELRRGKLGLRHGRQEKCQPNGSEHPRQRRPRTEHGEGSFLAGRLGQVARLLVKEGRQAAPARDMRSPASVLIVIRAAAKSRFWQAGLSPETPRA